VLNTYIYIGVKLGLK